MDARVIRSCLACMAFVVGVYLAVPSAKAASEASPERAAKRACLAGEVAKGVAILADLYVTTDDPVYIFNQGRCFEQNGKYEEAIIRFREFLQKNQDAGEPSDPSAEKHITKCQALLDSQRQRDNPAPSTAPAATDAQPIAPATPPASAPSPAPAAAPPPLAAPSPEPSSTPGPAAGELVASPEPLQQARAENRGSGLRVAGIAAVAVGVAGIATGIALNVKANSIARELETNRPFLRSRENTRATYETWGWVGYGVGGVCLAGGAILYYLGYLQSRSGQVALVPSAEAGSFGAALQGVF